MKPHIKRSKVTPTGNMWAWHCTSKNVEGVSNTPEHAWHEWRVQVRTVSWRNNNTMQFKDITADELYHAHRVFRK